MYIEHIPSVLTDFIHIFQGYVFDTDTHTWVLA